MHFFFIKYQPQFSKLLHVQISMQFTWCLTKKLHYHGMSCKNIKLLSKLDTLMVNFIIFFLNVKKTSKPETT